MSRFKLIEIESIEVKHYKGTVHDLTVEDNHSYNIEGTIVHNSACSTRIKTGMGVPQLTAIKDCSRVSVPIIADGGIRSPGDVCKAIAAGASMVMLGGMLAGTDETPGEIQEEFLPPTDNWPDNKPYGIATRRKTGKFRKVFRGMASKEANEDQFGAMADWKTAEGVSTTIPCKGPVEAIIKDIIGGLRSSMTYNGACDLDEFRKRSEFVRITHAGRIEATPHILG